ncbi:up-regulator of cell proliferation [Syngnathoides biaculeatus]|uniref:up-regulator of cell proliferation n=1 Tax=Syngnathoides biaculeatus TaxID=300417 RepID=UPI002ADD6EDF|nr:up-regulator of cell proliferation [Syngnathoides biaculeatus]
MSTELSKKLSSKRKKLPKNTSKYEVLVQLGLEAFYPSQLEPASILDLSTWILENLVPREPNDLPKSFLQRLWLLRPDARSTCCKALSDITASPTEKDDDFRGLRSCNVNPLELVTAVFMCANTFLQQEITTRMLQCQFATPLLLPHLDDEKPSGFLLWPLRDVVRQWQTQSLDHNQKVQEAVFASTFMPMMSCVRLGSCSVSKSEVLNHVIGTDTFIHKGMEGGQLPRTLSNGLVETAWTLPAGDPNRDSFPLPVVFANLRGDASTHEKCLYFLSQASSALIVFCENPTEKERQLLVTCKDMTPKLIVIDLTEAETKEDRAVKFIGKNLQDQLCLPDGSVVTGSRLNAGSIANVLCDALNILLPDLRLVTLEGAAKLAVELGMDCDEGKVCKRSMGSAEEVLKGLDKGHVVFRQKQLPLQGAMWSRLAEIEKMESKKNKEGKVFDPHLQKEKKDIIGNLSRYRMTPCMKNFTKAVSTTDKVERMYFLSWMRLKLRLLQMQKQINLKDLLINQQTKENNGIPEQPELQNGLNDAMGDSDSFCTDSTFEDGEIEQLAANDQDSFFLGLEHFLREMGLIFELSHISPGNDSHNGPQLPSVAADLILSGIPLEIMDGDSSYIPIQWVGGVLTEINHRFPQNHFRTLTSLGVHQAKNAEILSALFGVKFLDERKRSTRGLYIDVIQLPLKFKKKLNCDFLLLIDVEGLCSSPANGQISTQISDNEMATFATGMSDVLLQNLFSRSASEFETSLTVAVNALLRIREYGSIPICKVLVQDEGINTILEAAQLKRVSNILQTKTGERTLRDGDTMTLNSKKKSSILYVRPWHSDPLSRSVDTQHSEAMLKLKRRLFGALKEAAAHSETCGLPEFMRRLCSVWEAVKAESFSISLQNKEIALAFSLFCTELSQQEDRLLEYMENWLMQATKTISLTKPESLDPSSQNDFLCELKYEARREVKREVNKQRLSVKTSLKENKLDVYVKKLGTIILSNLTELEERVTTTVIERLEMINENHCSSTQLNRIETILQTHQNARLEALLDNSESDKQLTTDEDLEEEFEDIWKEALSNFDFRPSDAEDITTRVKTILSANLINRGLQKHLNKLLDFGQNQTTFFRVDDQYFGYSSRMKNLFENNNKSPKAKAQQLASNIMEYYQQFVEDKVSVPQDFSDSYITELLEMIDKTLKETHLDTRTAFEVDLKVFICNAACRDFQRVHNRFAKDGELLKSIKAKKSSLMTDFIYQFRKTDQRQRLAHRFISDIIQPTVMDYVYKPLGMQIADDIKSKAPHYLSPQAFHKSLLEGLIKDDTFESFTEYLLSYDSFRLRKIQETVVAHLSDWNVNTWRQQRLGDIIGKVAAAASQVFEGTSAALSDTKPMLEQVCLILEDGDACIPWESLKGPLFNITTDWDRFITCFMELLAALRLDLAQAFSQPIGSDQLLECLPTQPRDCLFNKVKGCDALCPVCSTPCEVEQTWHRVHQASLHRPTCMLEPTSLTSPECANPDDLGTKDVAVACWEFQPLHLDWNLSPGETSNQTPSPYWRYVLARFNDRFAKKYNQKPPLIPEEWKAMTQQDALDSLRENFFHTGEL